MKYLFDIRMWCSVFLALIVTTTVTWAANNSIYITQSGTALTMTIDQIGNSNVVGTDGTRATFTGTTVTVDVDQVGDSNTLAATVAQGNNTSFTVNTTGDSNVSSITGGGSGDIAGTDFDYAATGDSNVLTFVQGASAAATSGNQDFAVTGTSNDVNVSCEVVGCVNSWTVSGNSNDIDTTQTGNASSIPSLVLYVSIVFSFLYLFLPLSLLSKYLER